MGKTILLVGASGVGRSVHATRAIEFILASVAMTMHEPFILEGEVITGQELQDRLNAEMERPTLKETVMEIRPYDLPVNDYQYTKEDLKNAHPFSKFMGNKRKKW